jgi:hypothetical protein
MRRFVLVAVTVVCWLVPTLAHEPKGERKESASDAFVKELERKESAYDALFQELAGSLPKKGQRAKSARLELDYWHKNAPRWLHSAVRKSVKTKDGKAAEVVFLNAPTLSMPGTDFSMAFLLVEKRVVDWASCWTSNRTARQELLLEDVDGDGVADVAFRASKGWWGLSDERQHGRPGDNRKWLYAYAITSKGFQSLFPNTDRDLKVKLSFKTAGQPVRLKVKGLPQSLRERQMVECTLSATNTSNKDLAIKRGKWFSVDIYKGGYFMTCRRPDKPSVLKPGQAISQVIHLFVEGPDKENTKTTKGTDKEITIRWKFVPKR